MPQLDREQSNVSTHLNGCPRVITGFLLQVINNIRHVDLDAKSCSLLSLSQDPRGITGSASIAPVTCADRPLLIVVLAGNILVLFDSPASREVLHANFLTLIDKQRSR
jgi:hypothetical protein